MGRALIDTGANVIVAAETAFANALASRGLDEREGLNLKVNVSPDSHFMGVLGTALFALDHIHSSRIPVEATKTMAYTVGIDVGSTYAKALVLSSDMRIARRAVTNTGFKLAEVARKLFDRSLAEGGLEDKDIAYVLGDGLWSRHGEFQ